MSQNTRLLLIALVILVVFGIFLQSLIARSLQESFSEEATQPRLPPTNPTPMPGLDGLVVPVKKQPTTKQEAQQVRQPGRPATGSR